MRSRWLLSLIVLGLLSGIAWRLEIEHHGWEGLTWTGSPHRALPAGLFAFIVWALAAGRFHEGWSIARLAAFGTALCMLAVASTSLLYGGMAVAFSRFGAGLAGFAFLALVWIAQPFVLFGLARFVFRMRARWSLLGSGAALWLAAVPIACTLLWITGHKGGADFLHAIKSGFVIPFLFVGLGLVVLPVGERVAAPRENVMLPISAALLAVLAAGFVAVSRATMRAGAARDLAAAIEKEDWRVVFPGINGVFVFPPVVGVPEHRGPVDPDFAVTRNLRRAAFIERGDDNARARLLVLDSRGTIATVPFGPSDAMACPRLWRDGFLYVRVSSTNGGAHFERIADGGAGAREELPLVPSPDPGGPYSPLPCFQLVEDGTVGWYSNGWFHVQRPDLTNRSIPGSSCLLTPDGSWVVTRVPQGFGLVRVADGERRFIVGTDDDLVAISPDGKWVATREGERSGLLGLVEGHGRGRYVAWRIADGAGPVPLPGVPDDATGFGFAQWIDYDPAP